jgi:hypothetical protein
MRRARGIAHTSPARLMSSLVALLAALMVLMSAPAHAGPSDTASCMPEMVSDCCDGMDHTRAVHDGSMAGPVSPDVPDNDCADMDCAAMTTCAAPAQAVLSRAVQLPRLLLERHGSPVDGIRAPLPPSSLPEQPPRV